MSATTAIDANEAPVGYFAVLKDSLDHSKGNLCRQCDWRSECQKAETDFRRHDHRCVSYAIVTPGGEVIQRRDGCSVIFKRLPLWTPTETDEEIPF